MGKHRRILVETHEGFIPLSYDEILLGESDFKRCIIHTRNGNRYPLETSLKKLEEILKEEDFLRVSRQWLVRADCIASVGKLLGGRSTLHLKNVLEPATIEISAEKYHYILSALE